MTIIIAAVMRKLNTIGPILGVAAGIYRGRVTIRTWPWPGRRMKNNDTCTFVHSIGCITLHHSRYVNQTLSYSFEPMLIGTLLYVSTNYYLLILK